MGRSWWSWRSCLHFNFHSKSFQPLELATGEGEGEAPGYRTRGLTGGRLVGLKGGGLTISPSRYDALILD